MKPKLQFCFRTLFGIILVILTLLSEVRPLLPPATDIEIDILSEGYHTNHHKAILDKDVDFTLEWDLDSLRKSIIFNISAETNGYIAFGLARRNQVKGADVAICGVDDDGKPYIVDMNGVEDNILSEDVRQDWKILKGEKNAHRVTLTIERELDTCDEEDVSFNDGLVHAIWDYGMSKPNYHKRTEGFKPRGHMPIYFKDPELEHPHNHPAWKPWRISRKLKVPPRHTSYWCSIVKGPKIKRQHQIVDFRPYLSNELAKKHVHHQLVYRCSAPLGADPRELFEPFAGQSGEECYLNDRPSLPSEYCRELVHMWAVGGKGAELPEDTGFQVLPNDYFLFESHYDNPEERKDLVIESGVDFQLSSKLRTNNAGIMFVGYGVFGLFTIPPESKGFEIAGHCGPQCTRNMLEKPGGMEIFGVTLHGHTAARRMRLKHFRGDKELPWVMNDDNYDFNVQQVRYLPKRLKVLPGDQLTMQCAYNNSGRKGSTLSGFSTNSEMCMAFLYLKRRIPHTYCTSELPTKLTMARFGVLNMTWETERHERIVTADVNPAHVGLPLSKVIDYLPWTPAQRADLFRQQKYGLHEASCPNYVASGRQVHQALERQQKQLDSDEVAAATSILQLARLNLRSISTPAPSSTVSHPKNLYEYRPPTTCPVRKGEKGWSSPTTAKPTTTTTKGWSAPTTTKGWVSPTTTTKGWSSPTTTTTKGWSKPTTTKGWTSPPTTKGWSSHTTTTKGWTSPPTTTKGWSTTTTTPGWSSPKIWYDEQPITSPAPPPLVSLFGPPGLNIKLSYMFT